MVKRTLIVGTGPVAIQLAVLIAKNNRLISMAARCEESKKSRNFYEAYLKDCFIKVDSQNESYKSLGGSVTLHKLYKNLEEVSDDYEELILAVTADAYLKSLRKISTNKLRSFKKVILVSPTFGSNILVEKFFRNIDCSVEVISFSTYLGDTRILNSKKTNQVMTTGVKKKIYIGSTFDDSKLVKEWMDLLAQHRIIVETTNSPLEAEVHNISLYVHPPLFMNEFALNAIFDGTEIPVYVYKMFPEGPITMELIKEMRLLWEEMNTICFHLKVLPINLLKTMVDENYPVMTESLPRNYIDTFETLDNLHQEYLLYVRYTSILIDPFSRPDKNGKYFDFSAIPFKQVYSDDTHSIKIPRMPKEDYYRLKIIQEISNQLNIDVPMINKFIKRYENKVREFKIRQNDKKLSIDFDLTLDKEELTTIRDAINNRKEDINYE